jgi:hypothetical protein
MKNGRASQMHFLLDLVHTSFGHTSFGDGENKDLGGRSIGRFSMSGVGDD